MSWDSVVFDGLVGALAGSVLGGSIAGLVAFKTVQWTQRGDREAATLAVSERAAETMLRATILAATRVQLALARQTSGGVEQLIDWEVELSAQQPFLIGKGAYGPLVRFGETARNALAADAAARKREQAAADIGDFQLDEFGDPELPSRHSHVQWTAAAQEAVDSEAFRARVALQRLRGVETSQLPVTPVQRTTLPSLLTDDVWPRDDTVGS